MCYRTGRPAERRIVTGTVVDNREAQQLYLGRLSRHPRNPLAIGEEFVAVLEPGVCVAVLPADSAPEFPVEISLPDAVPRSVESLPIADQIEPDE